MVAAELKLQPTLCQGLVEAVAVALRAQAAEKSVQLVVAGSAEDPVARTDRRLLGTILMSLIARAIDGAPRGVVRLSVLRSSATPAPAIEFRIAQIAAPGGRRAAARTGVPALDGSEKLAARLGGTIAVDVRPAEGSTIVLRIPEG